MTKAYYQRPKQEIRFVKPGDEEVYEYWVMEPRLLGRLVRHGTQRITTEDGKGPFTNHAAALRYLLERNGLDAGLASSVWVKAPNKTKKWAVTGTQMLLQGKWIDYATQHRIDPKNEKNVTKLYKLTEAEIEALGLKGVTS